MNIVRKIPHRYRVAIGWGLYIAFCAAIIRYTPQIFPSQSKLEKIAQEPNSSQITYSVIK